MSDSLEVSRRHFIKGITVAGIAAQGLPLMSRAEGAGKKFKVGLIGCGGRGNAAVHNHIEAAKVAGVDVEVFALADAFPEKALGSGKSFKVPAERCFGGFDAYHKLLELPVDIVLMATPPAFRPVHFEASVKAGKHCFIEKPVAVDAPGARRMLAAGEEARKKGLSVVAGTQRRHMTGYRRNQEAVAKGAIGRILGGTVMWCGGKLWLKERQQGESDASYMVRNWTSFAEMSGDHIVEQHVHNLDVANWFIGRPPVMALGFGGRARRKTGDQFDFFSVDFDYGEDLHIHSMCRQVNGCYGRTGEFLAGAEGSVYGGGKISRFDGKKVELSNIECHDNGQVEEHVALLRSIVAGQPCNEVKNVVEATVAAIMGRISAYTGDMVRFSDLMTNKDSKWYNLALAPAADDFEKGPVVAPKDDVVAVPGSA